MRQGVERLRVFGSVLTDHVDPDRSDVNFLVEFKNSRQNVFHDYFDLKAALEQLVGCNVDLVATCAVKIPDVASPSSTGPNTSTRPDNRSAAHIWTR